MKFDSSRSNTLMCVFPPSTSSCYNLQPGFSFLSSHNFLCTFIIPNFISPIYPSSFRFLLPALSPYQFFYVLCIWIMIQRVFRIPHPHLPLTSSVGRFMHNMSNRCVNRMYIYWFLWSFRLIFIFTTWKSRPLRVKSQIRWVERSR